MERCSLEETAHCQGMILFTNFLYNLVFYVNTVVAYLLLGIWLSDRRAVLPGNAFQRYCLVFGNPQAVIILFFSHFCSLIFLISLLTALRVTILEGTAGPSLRTSMTDKPA